MQNHQHTDASCNWEISTPLVNIHSIIRFSQDIFSFATITRDSSGTRFWTAVTAATLQQCQSHCAPVASTESNCRVTNYLVIYSCFWCKQNLQTPNLNFRPSEGESVPLYCWRDMQEDLPEQNRFCLGDFYLCVNLWPKTTKWASSNTKYEWMSVSCYTKALVN